MPDIGPFEIGIIALVILVLSLTFGWKYWERLLHRGARSMGSLQSEIEIGRLEGQRALAEERQRLAGEKKSG